MNTVEAVSYLLEHNLHFRAEVSLDDATEVLRKFRHYNEIPDTIGLLPKAVADGIGPVDFGGDNPNNGTFINLDLFVGNEYSFVVYVQSSPSYRKGDTPERQMEVLEKIGRDFCADEVTVETIPGFAGGAASLRARFWWD